MKKTILTAAAMLLSAQAMLAQVRVQGRVTDPDGKPVVGAKITLTSDRAGQHKPNPSTDKRGTWAALLPIGGKWNIDIEAQGFVTAQGSMHLSEAGRNPVVETTIQRVAAPVAAPPEPETIAPTVPPAALEAVQRGEEFMRQARGERLVRTTDASGKPVETIEKGEAPAEEQRKELYKQAVVEFEKAQALLPEHIQLKQALAQAYYQSGQLTPAVALLKQVYEADPSNTGVLLLLINLVLEQGNLEEGRALLAKVPAGSLTDPTLLVNVGILFLNKNNPEDARGYFDQAVNVAPARGESYYYRGLASLQLKNMNAARADFQKAIELAPNSTEAGDARDLLKQMR